MANRLNSNKELMGAFVYQPFLPNNPGVVIKVEDSGRPDTKLLTVKWLNGLVSQHADHRLNDFQGLIDDHRKKLNTHENKLQLLKESLKG